MHNIVQSHYGVLTVLADIAGVSKSGYYKWLHKKNKPDKDHIDFVQIKKIFEQGNSRFGYRRITMALHSQGIVMNSKKVLRIMRKYNLVTHVRKARSYRQFIRKTEGHKTVANVLKQDFQKKSPYRFFSTDITYLPYRGGRAFLSVVKDIASGEILTHHVSNRPDLSLSVSLISQLQSEFRNRGLNMSNILIHSDQGGHYTSPQYRQLLTELKVCQSMSRRGNCLDNATVESFFGHLKDEISFSRCISFMEIQQLVDNYINYYNTQRHQWHRKKMTPVEYRNHLLEIK